MTFRILALGAALAVLAPAAGQAAPLMQTVTGVGQANGDSLSNINFLPFDPAQGTLASVTIELSGSFTPGNFLDNVTAATANLVTTLNVVPTLGTISGANVTVSTQNSVPVSLVGGGSGRFTGAATTVDEVFTFTDAADFEGTSTTPVNLAEFGFFTRTVPQVGGPGSDETTFSGQAVVTYNLQAAAVPEPMTALVFGAGLLGLGWMRRRPG